MKKCIRCGEIYPATTEYFRRTKANKNTLFNVCESCCDKYEMRCRNRRTALIKKLPAFYTKAQWRFCKEYFNNTCCYCGKEGKLEKDHFIPLKNGGEYNRNNIVCACRSCNSNKGGNDPFNWYRQQECHSKAQENKILKYLNYENSNIQQLGLF